MNKLEKKNLFLEINDKKYYVAVGEYDEELNFKIVEREVISSTFIKNGKILNLDDSVIEIKKIINKIETNLNLIFSDINVVISQTDFDCINVNGFKRLNGNQILSDDISYILNDIKSKLVETEKHKKIIHLFNTKFQLDDKIIKNLPIGLHGEFYSHQLTCFMINNNDFKDINTLLNKCNLGINQIVLKSFINGIKIINRYKKDTFVEIKMNKNNTQLTVFYESAFCFFQKFNFGSDIILKDIAKVCSLPISTVHKIIQETELKLLDKNAHVDKKYFDNSNFRKISLNHLIEISSARIEEILNIIYNQNKNIESFKDKKISVYFEFEDKNIIYKIKDIFENYFHNQILYTEQSSDGDPFNTIKIFGDLLSKGWAKEAIPVTNKKKSLISRIFSGLFE